MFCRNSSFINCFIVWYDTYRLRACKVFLYPVSRVHLLLLIVLCLVSGIRRCSSRWVLDSFLDFRLVLSEFFRQLTGAGCFLLWCVMWVCDVFNVFSCFLSVVWVSFALVCYAFGSCFVVGFISNIHLLNGLYWEGHPWFSILSWAGGICQSSFIKNIRNPQKCF